MKTHESAPLCPQCSGPATWVDGEIREEHHPTPPYIRKYLNQYIYQCKAGHTWKVAHPRYYQAPQAPTPIGGA